MKKTIWLAAVIFSFAGTVRSQEKSAIDSLPVRLEDVASVDAIIKALYDVISGPAGQARNWNRMRTLFKPDAIMIPTGKRPDGKAQGRIIGVEDYIKIVGPQLEKTGFFETEIGRRADTYGNIAQVFSTYESKNKKEDTKPFMRGINSIQLWNDGNRWWIMSIFWQGETPDTPIPTIYLNKNGN